MLVGRDRQGWGKEYNARTDFKWMIKAS